MQPYNPIEHIVIIVKENHSFDNYFGSFPGANGAKQPPAQDPPVGGDPPHDHAAWLQRTTGSVKLQYSEKCRMCPGYTRPAVPWTFPSIHRTEKTPGSRRSS